MGPEDGVMQVFQREFLTPESDASRNEMGAMLEKAVLALPDGYREVVVLRDIEEMNTAETAEACHYPSQT